MNRKQQELTRYQYLLALLNNVPEDERSQNWSAYHAEVEARIYDLKNDLGLEN